MLENAYEAAGRVAAYLSEELESSPFEYIPNYPPNYEKNGVGWSKPRVDSFTDLCLDVFEGDLDSIRNAINGQGFGDSFWLVDARFVGSTATIASELEAPACALTLRHALGLVKEYSDNYSARIKRASVCEADNKSIVLEFAGGGRMELRPMSFSVPSEKYRRIAERTYKHLRQHSGNPFTNLRKIPGLTGADCIRTFYFGEHPEEDDGADHRVSKERNNAPHDRRGPHLCIHPKGLALEFQAMWKLLGGGTIRLSRCQEAVARYLGARNWNQLIAIDPNQYWAPVVLSIGSDPDVTDQWDSHAFYRNAKDGLAGLADFLDNVDVAEWHYESSIFRHCSLRVTAKFGDKYVQVRPFTTLAFGRDWMDGCPSSITETNGGGVSDAVMRYLGVGLSRDEAIRKSDQELGSTTLVLPGLKVRRMPRSSYQDYIVVDVIRDDGSRVGRVGEAKTEETYLLHHADKGKYEIVFEQVVPRQFSSGGLFDDDLTEKQEALLMRIFQDTGLLYADTIEEVVDHGRRHLKDEEVDYRMLNYHLSELELG